MIGPTGAVRVMIATRPVDFRKGAEGLAALVRESMGADPFSGAVYVFRARRADRIKLVYFDGTGVCLFSNLSSPNYEWTPEEALTYFQQITAAQEEALALFKDTKRWRTSKPPADEAPASAASNDVEDVTSEAEADAEVEDEGASDEAREEMPAPVAVTSRPGIPKNHPRNLTISQIMAECKANEPEMLAEMIILQRRVIYDQAKRLGEDPSYPSVPAAA